MAERRIVEGTGQGIVCYISNYSWLDGLSFTGMRERYLETFDKIWIDCLNGDNNKTGKLTPEGDQTPVSSQVTLIPKASRWGQPLRCLCVGSLISTRMPCVSATSGVEPTSRPARYSRAGWRESVPAS